MNKRHALVEHPNKRETRLIGLHVVGNLLAILLKILLVETVKYLLQVLQELNDQGTIVEESKEGKNQTFDHGVRDDRVQPLRQHMDEGKQEPEASPFLLRLISFVQVVNRHKQRRNEHEIGVKAVVSEKSVQNTKHYHGKQHRDVVERDVDLVFQLLELLYTLLPGKSTTAARRASLVEGFHLIPVLLDVSRGYHYLQNKREITIFRLEIIWDRFLHMDRKSSEIGTLVHLKQRHYLTHLKCWKSSLQFLITLIFVFVKQTTLEHS